MRQDLTPVKAYRISMLPLEIFHVTKYLNISYSISMLPLEIFHVTKYLNISYRISILPLEIFHVTEISRTVVYTTFLQEIKDNHEDI